jgi:hypothetical protein
VDWSRTALFDRTARRLPLAVTWSCDARAQRDSNGQNLEQQGFRGNAGFFYELGLRASNEPVNAGRGLRGGVWWVCVRVQRSGRVLGLIRVINRDKPGNADLTVVGGRTPGVDVVGRFAFDGGGRPFEVGADLDLGGWRLRVEQGGREVLGRSGRWSDGRAPITSELSGDAYLWQQLGNWSSGRGRGSLKTVLGPK